VRVSSFNKIHLDVQQYKVVLIDYSVCQINQG